MNRLSKLENLTAYTVVEKKELKEVNGYGYILSHNKTKARVAVIENDDTNKVFTICLLYTSPSPRDCS